MIPQYQLKQLQEQRSRANSIASGLLAGSGLSSPEKRSQFDAAIVEVENLTRQINTELNGPFGALGAAVDTKREARHAEAFGRFVRKGDATLSDAMRSILSGAEKRDGVNEGGDQTAHIGSYSSLGYFVPTGFINRVEQATKYFAPLLEDGIFTVIRTASGNALPFPVSDDTGNAAVMLAEAAPVSEEDITANHVVLSAKKATSGVIKASIELLQDSAIDVEGWLAERFGERYGRGYENFLTNGTGGTQPTGLLTALAANGVTPVVAAGANANSGLSGDTGANSIGYQDLVNLEHSVDPSYRRNAKFMLSDNALASIKKILDKFGRPLWSSGISAGDPPTILGYQYVINQSMPSIAPSATTVVFGDLKKFVVRRVLDMSMIRLVEKYAGTGEVGFQSFNRVDSNLVVASSTHPINYLRQSS
jgi:HK97 family phage major capsid protein